MHRISSDTKVGKQFLSQTKNSMEVYRSIYQPHMGKKEIEKAKKRITTYSPPIEQICPTCGAKFLSNSCERCNKIYG